MLTTLIVVESVACFVSVALVLKPPESVPNIFIPNCLQRLHKMSLACLSCGVHCTISHRSDVMLGLANLRIAGKGLVMDRPFSVNVFIFQLIWQCLACFKTAGKCTMKFETKWGEDAFNYN